MSMWRYKHLFLSLFIILTLSIGGLTTCGKPAAPPASISYTAGWAQNQVSAYLNSLAKSPDAIRYLAELNSQGYFESRFHEGEVDQDLGGHKYSGWSVYYKPNNRPSREYWDNLNWAVCKDGYVVEGSDDALSVKADLIELNQ